MMRIDRTLQLHLARTWLVTLVAAHVVLRAIHPDLGHIRPEHEGFLFLGLNLPTMAIGAFLPKDHASWRRAYWSLPFLLGMAVILVNFMITGATPAGRHNLAGLLTLLTAQALWLAWPVYWMIRALAGRRPGSV